MPIDILTRWPRDNKAESFNRRHELLNEVTDMLNGQILGLVNRHGGSVHIFSMVNELLEGYRLIDLDEMRETPASSPYSSWSDEGLTLCGRKFVGTPHYAYILILKPDRVRQHVCLLYRSCLREFLHSQNRVESENPPGGHA